MTIKTKIIVPTLLLALALGLQGCNWTPAPKDEAMAQDSISTTTAKAQETADDFLPHNFRYTPESWDGCLCEFSESEYGYNHGTFIYANNLQDSAIFYVDGKEVSLQVVQQDTKDEDVLSETASNADYEVRLEGKKTGQVDYQVIYEGTLTIKRLSDGQVYKSTLYGSCGC